MRELVSSHYWDTDNSTNTLIMKTHQKGRSRESVIVSGIHRKNKNSNTVAKGWEGSPLCSVCGITPRPGRISLSGDGP